MLYPVIDVGSNTVKLAVLDEELLFRHAPVFFKAHPLRIKSKIVDGRLPEGDILELAHLVKEFVGIAGRLTQAPPLAFATASLRGLSNQEEVCRMVKEISGVEMEVISGEEEAYYSFLGARGSVSAKAGISVDLGGGSTELLAFRDDKVLNSTSLPLGCLTLYPAFFENGKDDMAGCRARVREELKKAAPPLPGNNILLSGGSAKAVLRYKNFLAGKKNRTLETRHFEKVERHFYHGNLKERNKIEEVLKDRFCLIPPALAVFSEIARFYGIEKLLVSRGGVREGRLHYELSKK